jgi:hypothetical protein
MKIRIITMLFLLATIACQKTDLYEYPMGKSSEAMITGFTLTDTGNSVLLESAVIDTTANTVTAKVPATIDIKKLVPRAEVTEGVTVTPQMGVYTDFSSPVTYTLTSSNREAQRQWTIIVVQVSE